MIPNVMNFIEKNGKKLQKDVICDVLGTQRYRTSNTLQALSSKTAPGPKELRLLWLPWQQLENNLFCVFLGNCCVCNLFYCSQNIWETWTHFNQFLFKFPKKLSTNKNKTNNLFLSTVYLYEVVLGVLHFLFIRSLFFFTILEFSNKL